MTYQLYRVATPGGDITGGTLLGDFDTYPDALRARDDDTLRLFTATRPGDALLACHQILGPGALGPRTPHAVTTELPRPAAPNSAGDVTGTEAWLRRIHRTP